MQLTYYAKIDKQNKIKNALQTTQQMYMKICNKYETETNKNV